MNAFYDFEFETNDGLFLNIEGSTDFSEVKFKAFDEDGNPIKKSKLTNLDVKLIEEFIMENAELEIEMQSDYESNDF